MTRKVFDNGMVAHVWAQQTQDEGRSHNGNFSFSGSVLYSYSTPIANMVRGAEGQLVALITSESYSVTTKGKHIGPAFRATDYGRSIPTFRVPFLGVTGGQHSVDSADPTELHAGNLEFLRKSYDAQKARMIRARDAWGDTLERLRSPAEELERYAAIFGLEVDLPDVDQDAAEVTRIRAEREAKANDPATIAKRARERERREERKAAKEAAEREAAIKAAADAVDAWRRGEHVFLPYNVPTMLRVEGDEIATSKRARFPVEHAKRAFRLVQCVRKRGLGYERSHDDARAETTLGHFRVDRVSSDGDVTAGCHFVKWAEIERCAKELGLLVEEPTAA